MKQGWKYGILEDAVNKGSSNISLKKIKGDDGEHPVFGAKGFVQNVSFYQQENEYLGIIKDGAGIGRVSKYPSKSSILATMQYILPKEGYDIQFINYFLNYIDFEKYRTGSTIPHIYYKDYKSEPFPLVKIDEQKRIVAKLDQCFEAIDKAHANVEKNLQNAKELFQSKLNEIFSQKGDGWEEKKLGEVCTFRQGIQRGVKLQSETKGDKQVRFLRIVDYTQGNELPRYIDNPGEQYIISEHDIALVRYGASTGFVCKGYDGALANNMFRVIPNEEYHVRLEFLYYYLKSSAFQSVVDIAMNGAAMPAISFGLINKIPFKIPTPDDQNKIVHELDALKSHTQALEFNYQQELDALDELKKSILQKAFNGEL